MRNASVIGVQIQPGSACLEAIDALIQSDDRLDIELTQTVASPKQSEISLVLLTAPSEDDPADGMESEGSGDDGDEDNGNGNSFFLHRGTRLFLHPLQRSHLVIVCQGAFPSWRLVNTSRADSSAPAGLPAKTETQKTL